MVAPAVVFQREQAAVLVVELEATQALLVAQETHQVQARHKVAMAALEEALSILVVVAAAVRLRLALLRHLEQIMVVLEARELPHQ